MKQTGVKQTLCPGRRLDDLISRDFDTLTEEEQRDVQLYYENQWG
jgi:hypothetical protein